MKGNKKKIDTDCTYNVVLARFHNESKSDMGKKQVRKFKRTVGITPKAIEMLYFGYQMPSTKSTLCTAEIIDLSKADDWESIDPGYFWEELHEIEKAG